MPITGDRGYRLDDVKAGKVTLDAFVAQLDPTELEAVSRGAYIMNSPLGAPGNAGVFGGRGCPPYAKRVLRPVTTTDGPSGIRLQSSCSLLPIGTLLACTFDEALIREVYEAEGREMRAKAATCCVAPGMNYPSESACSRDWNFELLVPRSVPDGGRLRRHGAGASADGRIRLPKALCLQ